jgi:hypothetical protein
MRMMVMQETTKLILKELLGLGAALGGRATHDHNSALPVRQ